MNVRYVVMLSPQERLDLRAFVNGGSKMVRRIKRAQVLLAADAGATDQQIATSVSVGTSTVFRTKRRFVEEGLEAALSEEPRSGHSSGTLYAAHKAHENDVSLEVH